jgi:hypothetical protein
MMLALAASSPWPDQPAMNQTTSIGSDGFKLSLKGGEVPPGHVSRLPHEAGIAFCYNGLHGLVISNLVVKKEGKKESFPRVVRCVQINLEPHSFLSPRDAVLI